MALVDGASVAAGAGGGGERYDLVDLAAGVIHFHSGIQESRRIHHQLQRFTGGRSSTRHSCGNFSTKR